MKMFFVVASLIAHAAAAAPPRVPSLLPSGYLSVKGNQTVDQHGHPVRLACVGYFDPRDVPRDVHGMAAYGFNCLRYPWYNGTFAENMATIDRIVAVASQVGLKVILDHHGNEVPGPKNKWLPYPCNGLPFDLGPGTNGTDGCGDKGTVTLSKYVEDWRKVAQRYKGNSTVIGFDLTNEPHANPPGWATGPGASWGDDSPTDLRAAYIQAGNAIQAINPDVLIIAEGVINFRDTFLNGEHNPVSGSLDLTLVPRFPATVNIPNKVVYSVHDYPSSISGAKIDSGPIKIQAMNVGWGFLETQNIAPVWIGEIGASLDNSNHALKEEQAWAATIVPYVNGQSGAQGGPTFSGDQQAIGTDWWAWGNLKGENPNGVVDDNGQPRPGQRAVYSQWLYYRQ